MSLFGLWDSESVLDSKPSTFSEFKVIVNFFFFFPRLLHSSLSRAFCETITYAIERVEETLVTRLDAAT